MPELDRARADRLAARLLEAIAPELECQSDGDNLAVVLAALAAAVNAVIVDAPDQLLGEFLRLLLATA